ncbi:MAG: hypothetical protein ACOVNU_13510 [Candidatus Kapaibacteriota bacterium]
MQFKVLPNTSCSIGGNWRLQFSTTIISPLRGLGNISSIKLSFNQINQGSR